MECRECVVWEIGEEILEIVSIVVVGSIHWFANDEETVVLTERHVMVSVILPVSIADTQLCLCESWQVSDFSDGDSVSA